MIIRLETQEDFSKIYELVKIAFQTAAVTSGHEQDFVNELRSGDHYIPELALVAEENGQLVGHIMLTKTSLQCETGTHEILFLGPVSVTLEKRKTGIGSALINEGFKRAREMGYASVILAGDPAYYVRFGFKSCGNFGITYEGVPDPYAMVCELTPDGLKGVHGALAYKGVSVVDIPRIFNIAESAHRIHNPFTPEKLATLGAALRLEPGTRVLDLGSGSGEMLCTWARDYGIKGTGIDMSPLFTEQAKLRADELGVADRVEFIHGDAADYVADEKVGMAACVGATWIGGGVTGTIELLSKSLRTGGIILIGEPHWRQLPPTEEIALGCRAGSISEFLLLPELLASFGNLGYDVVEMVLADQDSWDRYEATQWLTMRRWLEANPDDGFAKNVRAELTSAPERYARYSREYFGWGVFALMSR